MLVTNPILWFVTNLILYKAEDLLLIPSCKKVADNMLRISSCIEVLICCQSYLGHMFFYCEYFEYYMHSLF